MSAKPLTYRPGEQFIGKTSRSRYTLDQLIGRGGEGSVFAVSGSPDLVAKLYHRPMMQDQIGKIEALIERGSPRLARHAAWPRELLYSTRGAAGYIMPKISGGISLGEIATPKSRLKRAADMGYAKLVAVAGNAARAVSAFHESGLIIGDINGRNVLVMPDATVRIIDCDSVQIYDGNEFRCPVGTEEFLPPELFGKSLPKVRRQQAQDNFSLAVLIYLLLSMGRHPYAGSGLDSIGDAIKKHRHAFRWFADGSAPLRALGLKPGAIMTRQMLQLFRRAFATRFRLGRRPTSHEWAKALDEAGASLVLCNTNRLHHYMKRTRRCPWCAIEATGKPALFDNRHAGRRRGRPIWEWLRRVLQPSGRPV